MSAGLRSASGRGRAAAAPGQPGQGRHRADEHGARESPGRSDGRPGRERAEEPTIKLRWYIYDAHCLTMETGGGQTAPSIEWRAEALRQVSAGWDRPPDRRTIELWLRGALPENGNLETFESHALRNIAERGLEIGTGTIHDWAWGNAHWEYPGALRLEREEDAGNARDPDGYNGVSESEIGDRLRRAADEADRVSATRQATRLLAAACAMCNGDLHRKNIALAHGPHDEPFRVRLAPVYDFSS